MSEIKVDTLTGKTTANDITVTVGATATMSLEKGLAKSWSKVKQDGTMAIQDSFGLSSISDDGTGRTIYTLTNNMSSADYSANGTSHATNHWPAWISGYGSHTQSSSQYAHQGWDYTSNYRDLNNVSSSAHGDLA